MPTTTRILAAVGAVTALVFTACAPAEPETSSSDQAEYAPDGLETFYDQTIAWQSCDDNADFECGTVEVPMDYENPDGERIDIHLTRDAESADEPPMLVNPGGPGSSGIAFVQDSLGVVFSDNLLENTSPIGFDPRGVGASEPIQCETAQELDESREIVHDPSTQEGWEATVEDNAAYAQQCLERSGDIIGFVDTASAAKDMDVIRAALGTDQLDYFGISYGTKLGATYAELFPEQVGKFVLDSVLPPSAATFEVSKAQSAGFEQSLQAWAQWCADSTECNIGQPGDAESVMTTVTDFIAQVEEEPLTYPDGRTQPVSDLFFGIVTPLYSQDSWELLALAFEQALEDDYANSDYRPLFLYFADTYHGRQDSGEYSNDTAAFNAINCLDYTGEDKTFEQVQQEAQELTEEAPIFGKYLSYSAGCNGWPIDPVNPVEDTDAKGSSAIVVTGLTSDPATPIHFSHELADELDNSVHITVEGEGHGAYSKENECIVNAIDGYILDDELPEDDMVCE
ncbi:MAG TPA: alpha/beta hydrolase [Candidatus Yaniella excrementavium]|nr:alpha/beta hydrolase [Candidatus Yaniella excrementavium]